jgi:acyl-CoA synthetase (NDP forming)
MTMQSFFYPRGVVVVGSTSKGKLGYELVRQMLDGGYRDIYVVNPKAQGAFSAPGYGAVDSIERPIDLAVVVSPAPTVPAVLRDCGRAGVKAALILTAGFSEVGNHAGEAEIQRVARQYGIRFFGPNCAGILNTGNSFFPTLESRPPAGGVSVITQSGAVGGVILAWATEFGLGISKFVSYGNGADLKEIELLQYLAGDPETKVVALYSESVTDGRKFMQVVRACTAKKPLVVIKAGRTQSGQRAALSHTGSMAGTDAVYDAALRQCGAIRVHTIEEMFDLCKGFLHLPPVTGRRVAIVTNSGGPGVMAADRAEEVGLDLPEPSRATQNALREFLPAHCALKNPIDLTVEGTEDGYRKTLLAALQEYDAALALNVATPYLDSLPLAQGICDATQQNGKPVVASFLPRTIVADAIPHLQQRGIPNFATGERAVAVLARMAEYNARKLERQSHAEPPPPQDVKTLPGTGQMLEPEAMAWLRENGMPVPEFRVGTTLEEAKQGCREIGYPVVMKVISPEILHKSDAGGVVLDVRDDRAAQAAFETIQKAAADKELRGVVIYPMIQGAQEVLLGLSCDPQFGPVIAFGLGGIYTEVWQDIALRVAPIDDIEAMTMIHEIKSLPLLQGARGQAPCDLDALAGVMAELSRLPLQYPDIVELDLNPVFLLSEGLLVGDVRVIVAQGRGPSAGKLDRPVG